LSTNHIGRDVVQAPVPIESQMTESFASGPGPATDRQGWSLDLEIHPTGDCWVSAEADGRLVVYRLLHRGDRVTVIAREELILRVGDPEMFAYTLNGVLGSPLGQPGIPVTIEITENNYQAFLAGSAPEPGEQAALASVT
jgi:hypothetical protein